MSQSEIRRVTHETHYEYAQPAECSQQICILQPQAGQNTLIGLLRNGQNVLSHSLRIQPNPSTLDSHQDFMGNVVTHFEINYPHDTLVVVSECEVEVLPATMAGCEFSVLSSPWNDLAVQLQFAGNQSSVPNSPFRFPSKHVPTNSQLQYYGQLDFWPGRPIVQAALALMHRIYNEFNYVSGSTSINTTVQEVMNTRQGVCQDFAHVMLSVLRSLGLSARYVSGYMLTDPPPGQPKLMGADASHAWVSLWCGQDIGWVDFDPTNNQIPDTRYVTIALGRDYADVPPLRGVVHGGSDNTLSVAVTVL